MEFAVKRKLVSVLGIAIPAIFLGGCLQGGSKDDNGKSVNFSVSISGDSQFASFVPTISLSGNVTALGDGSIKGMWQQTKGKPIQLSNSNCSQADSKAKTEQNSKIVTTFYTCPVSITFPKSVTDEDYEIAFTATDNFGNTKTVRKSFVIPSYKPDPLVAVAGPNANLYPGQSYTGTCIINNGGYFTQGSKPTFVWSIESSIPSEPTPQLTQQDGEKGSTVTFTAPRVLSNSVTYHVKCEVYDSVANKAGSTADVTVFGGSNLPPLMANAGNAKIVYTGTPVILQGSAYTNEGTVSDGVYYYWEVVSGDISLANATSPTASFIAPDSPADIELKLYVSYRPITSSDLTAIPSSQTATTFVKVIAMPNTL